MSIGRVIAGRYRLCEKLGRGDYADVWRAEELSRGGPVAQLAVKIFRAEVDRGELALLADLAHPSILDYRAVVEDGGDVCLVTELAEGGTAGTLLREWPDGLPVPEVYRIVEAVVAALEHLHARNWVHRDVKPANILLVRGAPKLGDVGTARALEGAARGTAVASLEYSAPELFSGRVTPSVDVYALGCTVFELLTGRPPFEGSTSEIVLNHANRRVALPDGIPRELGSLILGCMEKEPAKRWTLVRVREGLAPPRSVDVPEGAGTRAVPPTTSTPTAGPAATSRAAPTAPELPTRPVSPAAACDRPSAVASTGTPLDPALRRHLRSKGDRWMEAAVWQPFFKTVAPVAREHGLAERGLIRRAEQLFPEVQAEAARELKIIDRVRDWVRALKKPEWSASAWARLLDDLDPPDEEAVAQMRDGLMARLYPTGAGATRVLDLGDGLHHRLVYLPPGKLEFVAAALDALMGEAPGASETAGIWFGAQPLSLVEWSALMQVPVPVGSSPAAPAMVDRTGADALLAAVRRRFPLDDLRWPTLDEYQRIKTLRTGRAGARRPGQPASPRSAQPAPVGRPAAAWPRHQPARGALRRRQAAAPGLAKSFFGALGAAGAELAQATGEAWLHGEASGLLDATGPNRRGVNLVSPISGGNR